MTVISIATKTNKDLYFYDVLNGEARFSAINYAYRFSNRQDAHTMRETKEFLFGLARLDGEVCVDLVDTATIPRDRAARR